MGINRAETISIDELEFNIFDLGEQDDFQVLWPEINEKSDGVVFVVDKSDLMNFEKIRQTFENIIEAQIQKDVIVLVLLNKSDIPDGMDRSQFIKEFDLLNLPYKWACYEISPKLAGMFLKVSDGFLTS